MPTRRIDDKENPWKVPPRCRDREHVPPSMQVFEPGVYEHECPACGQKQIFVVPERPTLGPFPALSAWDLERLIAQGEKAARELDRAISASFQPTADDLNTVLD